MKKQIAVNEKLFALYLLSINDYKRPRSLSPHIAVSMLMATILSIAVLNALISSLMRL